MPIVQDQVRGRLGNYSVKLYDTDDFSRDTLDVSLTGDVLIKYGDLERSAPKSILKSYTQLSFIDERFKLLEEFSQGFRNDRYIVEIYGPSVRWRGFVKEETRIRPFKNNISKQVTTLNCYGGITEGRIDVINARKQFQDSTSNQLPDRNVFWLSRVTKQLPIDGLGSNSSFDGGERIRSNLSLSYQQIPKIVGELYDFDLNDGESEFYPSPINVKQTESLYEAVKKYNEYTKSFIYRSLSEGYMVWENIQSVGVKEGVKANKNWPNNDDKYVRKTKEQKINEIQNFIVGEDNDGLRNLKQSGEVIIEIENDRNILRIGPRDISSGSVIIGYNVESQFFNDRINENPSSEIKVGNVDDSNSPTVTLNLPSISPVEPIGIVLEWDKDSVQKINSVKLEYNNSSGFTSTESSPNSNYQIVGNTTQEDISPDVEIDLQSAPSTGTDIPNIDIKARYINEKTNIIETLRLGSNDKGIDPVRIEDVYDFYITLLTKRAGTGNDDIFVDEPEIISGDASLNIGATVNALHYRSKMESILKENTTKTARFSTLGIYGPEYVHKADILGSTKYFISTGLEVSLRKGTTDVSAVEVNNHELI
jgi:hypothetical protein